MDSDQAFYLEWYITPLLVLLPLTVGRFAIRIQVYGRVFEDDIAYLVAAAAALVHAVCSYISDEKYRDYQYISLDEVAHTRGMVTDLLLFIGTIAIKLCVLFLYRDLFSVSNAFRKFWRVAVVWMALSTLAIMGTVLSIFGRHIDESSSNSYYYASQTDRDIDIRPFIAYCLDIVGSLITFGVPLGLFPSLHLRRPVNWWLAWVYLFFIAGFSMTTTAVLFTDDGVIDGSFGSWGLYFSVYGAAMLAYTPLVLPEQRKTKLWPWNRKHKRHQLEDDEQQKDSSTESLIDRNLKSRQRSTSLASSVHPQSRSGSEEFEMDSLRTSLEDVRRHKVVSYSHVSGRGLDMGW